MNDRYNNEKPLHHCLPLMTQHQKICNNREREQQHSLNNSRNTFLSKIESCYILLARESIILEYLQV